MSSTEYIVIRDVDDGHGGTVGERMVPVATVRAQILALVEDEWTYVRLTSDFTTSSGSAVSVEALSFAPDPSTRYEVEGLLLVRTATATVGPRPGISWPSGAVDGVADIRVASSATAEVQAKGNVNAAVLSPVGGLPNTTQSWPAFIQAGFGTGPSASGNFTVQMASETAGTNVTIRSGSFLKYRTIP